MQIAALAHDIERAIEDRKVKREEFKDYDQFKQAHAINSANITKEILEECGFDTAFIEKVTQNIVLHEVGGTKDSDILKNADSISFFDNNLIYYYKREGFKNTYIRVKWGIKRIDKKYLKFLNTISFPNRVLLRDYYRLLPFCSNS